MTVQELIIALVTLRNDHGDDIKVKVLSKPFRVCPVEYVTHDRKLNVIVIEGGT